MLIDTLQERIRIASPLTVEEFSAVKELLATCCSGYVIKSQKLKSPLPIGNKPEDGECYNPTTGYRYGFETGVELKNLAKKNGWCGQFAGEKQWQKIGRKIIKNEKPYEYGVLYGREIKLYAYEQTEV